MDFPVNNWSAFYGLPNGTVGDTYMNQAKSGSNCTVFDHTSYGFRTLG